MSGAQWVMGACDCMATLQGCIWDYEAACLQIQSGDWVGPSSVLDSVVPRCLPVSLHNPVQGLEAVCWWESGGLCGLHFKGMLGEILPRGKNSKIAGRFHTFHAGLNSHQSLAPGKGESADGKLVDSYLEGLKTEYGKAGELLHCFSFLRQPRICWAEAGS